ncbi:MAG: MarR family transcriptional regulator [Alphaproteobacteria bacterium]|nr:MarR family transcriptional regulator [Alphaproteobacteria bacterium]
MGQLLAKRTGKPAETVGAQPQEAGPAALPAPVSTVPDFELIELLFFAYRDFVGDADRLLEEFGFGRAHHRVLHFVNRHPGLTIAELLDILNITKQSLNRVLKELLEQGYVEARAGQSDRRQRRLFPAPRGEALALHLSQLQSARFARALRQLPPGARAGAVEFLLALIDEPARARVSALVWGQGKPSARQGEN